jgi:hypothetical protein
MNRINVRINGYSKADDVECVELRRLEGSTFEAIIHHENGSIERVLRDTSGKLDRLTIEHGPDESTTVYISGKGVRREGQRR